MILRRAIGVFLGAILLHLNAVRADRACATHHENRGAPSAAAGTTHAGDRHHESGVADRDGATPQTGEQCKTPAQPDCCQALASCSLLIVADESAVVASARFRDAPHVSVSDQPVSSIVAPDPPPPRA